MAKMVLTSTYVGVGGNDLSAYASKAELSVEVDEQDVTTFASLGWKESLGGLKSGTLAISFKQDVAAAALDSILWPLLGTVAAFEVRSTSSLVGASNPKWTGSVLINGLAPVSGSVGDVAAFDVSWPTSGVVTRATA